MGSCVHFAGASARASPRQGSASAFGLPLHPWLLLCRLLKGSC